MLPTPRSSAFLHLFAAALALLAGLPARGAQTPAPEDPLRAACAAFAEKNAVVGLGVAVIDDGKVLLDAGFGFADREHQRAAQKSTLYRLGSISKPVCAVLAMQLVEKEQLALDGPVGASVTGLPPALQPLSLRQLLSHTSGVRHYAPGRADNGRTKRSTREALELFVNDPLLFEPGTKYSYSTHAYTLVVAEIEAAAKRDYVALLRERLRAVAPTLDCEVASDKKPERSALYGRDAAGKPVLSPDREDNSWKYGGGGLESTALDLARFGQALLEDELVSAKTRESMWAPTKLADGTASSYGLGWRIAPDGKSVLHSGAQQGCHSMLLIVPGEGVVIAVLCNTQDSKAPDLAAELRKLLAGR